jgi:hypothetical protein
MPAAEEPLAQIADCIHPCPPPDMAGGYDQCPHGTWPCPAMKAAWLARGLDRGKQVRAACAATGQEAQIQDAGRDAMEEREAARREGRRPPIGRPRWKPGADPVAAGILIPQAVHAVLRRAGFGRAQASTNGPWRPAAAKEFADA